MEKKIFRTRELSLEYLKSNQGMRFTARQIAEAIVSENPNAAQYKMDSSRQGLSSQEELIQQVAAEIGAASPDLVRLHGIEASADRPRLYRFPEDGLRPVSQGETIRESNESSEHSLYPILETFLRDSRGLSPMRIDEKTSSGRGGAGSSHWLHPDLVALEDISSSWTETQIRSLITHYRHEVIRIWSFEVKKELTISNLRSSYFQAVSNSGWAHFGYLVAENVDERALKEAEILFGVHGVGIISLEREEPNSSQILIPARERATLDWKSVARLSEENSDFSKFLSWVDVLYKTGDWDIANSAISNHTKRY